MARYKFADEPFWLSNLRRGKSAIFINVTVCMGNDHYVSQSYLRAFILDGEKGFWVYDKVSGKSWPNVPGKIGAIRDLYGFQKGLEQDFAKKQENIIAPILKRWRVPAALPESHEIEKVAIFLAFLHSRGPKAIKVGQKLAASIDVAKVLDGRGSAEAVRSTWEQCVKNEDGKGLITSPEFQEVIEERVHKIAYDLWQRRKAENPNNGTTLAEWQELVRTEMRRHEQTFSEEGKPLSELFPLEFFQHRYQEVVQIIRDVKNHVPYQVALSQMLASAQTVTPYLLERTWCLCTAQERNFFITSDFPVIVFDRGSHQPFFFGGFRNKEADIVFPLSPRVCLLLSHTRTQKRCRVNERFVERVNKMLIETAEQYVISPQKTKSIERLIVQYRKRPSSTPREQQSDGRLDQERVEWMKNRIRKGLTRSVQIASLK